LNRFEAFVADRYLATRQKGAFVRVMVRFARWGIAVGVFAMVVALAVGNGFVDEIQDNLFTATGHLTLANVSGDIPDTAGALERIRATPGIVGATPMRMDEGILKPPGGYLPPASTLIWGIDPATIRSTSSLFKNLKPGRVEDLKEGEILIGAVRAKELNLRIGDSVALVVMRLDLGLSGLQPRMAGFRVAGIFNSNISEYDKNWCFVHLSDAMRMADSDQAAMIQVRTRNVDSIDTTKAAVLRNLNGGPKGPWVAQDLRDTNRMFFEVMKLEKWIFAAIFSLIVLVAAFNIIACLVMLVTEKRRDLGVLLALGATPRQVQRLFELQGLRIGMVGTLWGLGTSVPLCLVANHFKLVRLPPAVFDFITYVPLRLGVLDIVAVTAFPTLVAWLASRYPARKASVLDPVDALRSE
jgi:lipoprotein-releasing system permease protein